ncbi:DUF2892 domain-containing protein [Cyanobacterium aponinum UTEX 3222]|nr:DUF2892 domain-containing protein [Cyanobacterium aponinum]WPF90161.1 DUF2892 domain-containing protein [Cyanobacterium aponinum AL20115]WRL38624.1 DUF2892 domain-containing protein [Cyanobacterium aponinum UTEX 3221]WRL41087.1 DUF2892 domain-containing protein [Cyanobacterium aponinum UTEX 3222]
MMLNNVGRSDRFFRLIFASILGYLGLFIYDGTALGLGLATASVLLTISGVFGFCFLYTVLGINTNNARESSKY